MKRPAIKIWRVDVKATNSVRTAHWDFPTRKSAEQFLNDHYLGSDKFVPEGGWEKIQILRSRVVVADYLKKD